MTLYLSTNYIYSCAHFYRKFTLTSNLIKCHELNFQSRRKKKKKNTILLGIPLSLIISNTVSPSIFFSCSLRQSWVTVAIFICATANLRPIQPINVATPLNTKEQNIKKRERNDCTPLAIHSSLFCLFFQRELTESGLRLAVFFVENSQCREFKAKQSIARRAWKKAEPEWLMHAIRRVDATRIELANEFLEIFMPRVSRGRVILASRGSRDDAPRLKENNFLRELPRLRIVLSSWKSWLVYTLLIFLFFGVTALVFSLICCNMRCNVSMRLIG